MKTKEELNALKAEVEMLNKKLAELTEDELKQVTGGGETTFVVPSKGEGNGVEKEYRIYKNEIKNNFT